MANNLAVNPIVVDSTGVVVARPVKVKGILIRASADTWLVVFNNVKFGEGTARAGGVINFNYASDVANERSAYVDFGDGVMLDGLWALTLTDITNVLIYLA